MERFAERRFGNDFEIILRDGITAARNHQRLLAQSLLRQAIQLNPHDARPYLWLTETTDDLGEKREYLETAVAIDPTNQVARRGLALLNGKLDISQSIPETLQPLVGKVVSAKSSASIANATCPQCGAQMRFDIRLQDLVCPYCSLVKEEAEASAWRQPGEALDLVLPTQRGHNWVRAQHQLSCSVCGAGSLWNQGQLAGACPYCGSDQLVEPPETENVIDPHAIGLMKVDREAALRSFQKWLGEGWFTPDDLQRKAHKLSLRPAYYPFWIFDGTLEMTWSCEINQGSGESMFWQPRSGVEYELFKHELVPGISRLDRLGKWRSEDFLLDDLAVFNPDYLAGWPAMLYDLPVSEASLKARQQVLARLQPQMYYRAEPGKKKRNLVISQGKWSDITFKLALLPLWLGAFRYRGKVFTVAINGQTGEVNGERPRDNVKLVLLILTLAVAVFLIAWLILGALGSVTT